MTIVEFINARLDEEARLSDEVPTADEPIDVHEPAHGMWVYDDDYRHDSIVIDEVRLNREVTAKRKMLAYMVDEWVDSYEGPGSQMLRHRMLCCMAEVYMDHPDYRENLEFP